MKRRRDKRGGDWYLFFLPLLQGIGIWSLVIITLCGFTGILFIADKLGWFFVPTLVAYFSVLAAIAGWFYSRRTRIFQHMVMGDELFYETYPFERWLEQRRQRRKQKAKVFIK